MARSAELLAAFGQLEPLNRHGRPRRLLLRRPYLVDLLVRGSARSGLPEQMLAEENVVSLVYERLIRRSDGASPVGAENLCHQAIFMNHAPCAVTPLDPELIQVCNAVG